MRDEQTDERDAAIANWNALIARFEPANPPWLPTARNRVAMLSGEAPMAQQGGGSAAAPGPTAQDVEAARSMSKDDQQAMIRGMVDRLAGKLADNPADAAGWLRLLQARMVMGDREQAAKDLASARAQFAEGTPERQQIDAAAGNLGL